MNTYYIKNIKGCKKNPFEQKNLKVLIMYKYLIKFIYLK